MNNNGIRDRDKRLLHEYNAGSNGRYHRHMMWYDPDTGHVIGFGQKPETALQLTRVCLNSGGYPVSVDGKFDKIQEALTHVRVLHYINDCMKRNEPVNRYVLTRL